MRGIYEARCRDGIRCHDIHAEFLKDWFRHSELDMGATQIARQQTNIIRLIYKK
jgi:hypothetical protein